MSGVTAISARARLTPLESLAMAGETPEYGPVLTTAQVAQLLDLNPQTVQQMAKDGRLPAHRLPGARKYLFFLEDVLGFVRQHKVHPGDVEDEPTGDA